MIYYNNLSAFTEVHYGNTNIDEVYFGNNKVWPISTPPPQPTSAITYTAATKLNVDLNWFSPVATAETFDNGFGRIEFASPVISIGGSAFNGRNSLTSIGIPNTVTSIGYWAFRGCTSLTGIKISVSITNISTEAFSGCSGLQSITIEATTPPTLRSNAFYGSTCPIYVPRESVNAYKSAWSEYSSRIQAIP